ncbi:MAG TPA: hypothetical protein VIJ33_06670 [Solirubrobacteraceae bacterium]
MARKTFKPTRAVKAALIFACALAALGYAQGALARGLGRDTTVPPPTSGTGYSVTLEQCATSTVQTERSATFTAQMTATGTTQRMAMHIELEQRLSGETTYHTLMAPGLGVWQRSEAGVQIYKYVKQVTNLDAPAAYRAVVRFRWLGDKGRVLKRAETRTQHCLQPALPGQVTQTPAPVAS